MLNHIAPLRPQARYSSSLTEFTISLSGDQLLVNHRVVDTFKSKLNQLYKNQQN
ncbi:hypothetical protein FHW11_002827 [Pantoea agglomerans]|nr:hypothetical protein [Pantoea agglomerans]MBA8892765.1 hypothetical protein [Pantoea agglomerans]